DSKLEVVKRFSLIWSIFLLAAAIALAQRWRGRWGGGEGWSPEFDTCRTAREIPTHSTGTPNWTNETGFERDVFSFARIRRDVEIPILRKYLLNGGVLMADDFWGERQWQVFHREMRRVLPEREFLELPMEHPIFHCVFDLKGPKNGLQTPNFWLGEQSKETHV